MTEFRNGVRTAAVNFLASVIKNAGAIWGSAWREFMGVGDYGAGGVQEYNSTGSDYNRAFLSEVWVSRAVTLRGDAIAQVPLKCWATDNNGKREAVDHPSLAVLAETNPVGWCTGQQLWRSTIASKDLHGHFAWQLDIGSKQLPKAIYFWPPAVYSPMQDDDGFFSGIRLKAEEKRTIPASQLVYGSTMSLINPVKGTSRIDALKMPLNLRAYAQASNMWYFRNNQRPDWLLLTEQTPTDENVQKMRRLINQWAGGDNRRGPLILGGNMSAHVMTTQAKDAEWLNQMHVSQQDIASGFGIPIVLMNQLQNATLANVDAYKLMLWHDTMIPELDDLADCITRSFLWRWPDARAKKLVLAFDYSKVEGLGEDLNKIFEREMMAAKIFTDQLKEGALVPNQLRQLMIPLLDRLGMDSKPFKGNVPQGEDRMVQYTVIPSQQSSVQAIINIEAARSGKNASLIENVPGAEHVGDNAQIAALQEQANQQALLQPQGQPGDGNPPAGDDKPSEDGKPDDQPAKPKRPPANATPGKAAELDPAAVERRALELIA